MISFLLVGLVFDFIGSIALAGAFIKPTAQIEDEEAAYSGPNPYKLKNEKHSQRLIRIGASTLIVGFSLNISYALTQILPRFNHPWSALLLALVIMLIGFVGTVALVHFRSLNHFRLKEGVRAGLLEETLTTWIKAHEDKDETEFDDIKKEIHDDIDKMQTSFEGRADKEALHLIELVNHSASLSELIGIFKKYLRNE